MESLKHWRYVGLDRKASYQKNMLWSMGTVYILLLALMFVVARWPHPDLITLTVPHGSTIKHIQPERLTHVPPAAARGRQAETPGDLTSIMRILGHNSRRINVVRDEASAPDKDVQAIAGVPMTDDAGPVILADGGEFSDDKFLPFSAGGGGGDLLGTGDNTFGLPNGIYCPADIRWSEDGRSGRDTALTTPVFLGLAVPPFPSNAKPDDTGIVVVDITIDKDGYVSFKMQSVTPPSRGFGLVVEWAILRGEYRPRVVKGVAVDHTTRVTLVMVRNEEPSVMGQTAEFTHSTPDVIPVWLFKR